MNKKYYDTNKELWDELARLNYEAENEDYSVKSFLEGQTTQRSYELIRGRKIIDIVIITKSEYNRTQ
ncbi:hypothetical protein ES705_05739 [subsurface metagenome]